MQKNKFIVVVLILFLRSVGAVFAYNILRGGFPHEDIGDESPTVAEYRKSTLMKQRKYWMKLTA